jgi:hypothetical protein
MSAAAELDGNHPAANYVDFGSAVAGAVVEGSVEARNWTDEPVRLTGGTSDCSCVPTDDLPVTIQPGGGRAVTVRMRIPAAKPGAITRKAELLTDHPTRRVVQLRLGCRVLE